jgi:hypothetical protein
MQINPESNRKKILECDLNVIWRSFTYKMSLLEALLYYNGDRGICSRDFSTFVLLSVKELAPLFTHITMCVLIDACVY